MKTKEVNDEKALPAKELLEKMRSENKNFFAEIANFAALLEELGVTSYKLTGSVQDPIIVSYSIS